MAGIIVKLRDGDATWYLEWFSRVEAPVTYGMTRQEFEAWYRDEYGRAGMAEFEARMERVERTGCSSAVGQTVEGLIALNRAGDGGKALTRDEIVHKYCRPENRQGTA
jgi:hypothetical protein